MMLRLISAGVVFALCCVAQPAFADPVYRWTDANGVVNYGAAPPAALLKSGAAHPVDVTESVRVLESDKDRAARLAREQQELAELTAARDARLQRELLEARIATEKARQAALLAQADGARDRQTAYCAYNDDCLDAPLLVVVHRPRWRPVRPHLSGAGWPRPIARTSAASTGMRIN
jgi:hypothetical protein